MLNILFDIPPFNLISEYITGWSIIIFIIFIIYFIALRKYYINKETFYYSNIDTENNDTENNDTENNDTENNDIDNDVVENFAITNPLTTKPTTTKPPTATATNPSDPIFYKVIQDNIINTTLFDNLKLVPEQVMKCKKLYNTVIINYISEFTKLLKLIKNNKFLNIDKQFNIILNKGIDTIISFLNNDIKSMNILTRSSIKTDVLNITSNTINYLVDKENINLTNEINELARLNSTTIDYNSMVKNINVSRRKIEDYIEMDNLISKYGYKNNISNDKAYSVLDKSFILPIYERNFDRITQLVNSDFNDNYTKLTDKYGKAYTDYLNQKKKEELNVNPLEMLSKIESGVVNFLTNSSGKSNNSNSKNDLIEQYNTEYDHLKSNPLPKQNKALVNDTTLNKNNIYEDSGNLGNYLINNTTQKDMLEGFEVNTTPAATTPAATVPASTTPSVIITKPKINTTNNKKNENTGIVAKLFSGEFLEYVMEVINDKLSVFYTAYYKQFSNTYYTTNSNDNKSNINLDEHLIPAGFLLFILSMLFYFIDLTS